MYLLFVCIPMINIHLMSLVDDTSRVTLNEIRGEEGSDYINACTMDVSIHRAHSAVKVALPLPSSSLNRDTNVLNVTLLLKAQCPTLSVTSGGWCGRRECPVLSCLPSALKLAG